MARCGPSDTAMLWGPCWALALGVGRPERFHGCLQRGGDPERDQHRGVPAVLVVRDVGLMEAGGGGELALRPAASLPREAQRRIGHSPMVSHV